MKKIKNIYITRQIPEEGINLLKEKGYKLTISKKSTPPTKADLIKALSKKKYDCVVTLLTDHIDAEIFDSCPTVKLVANYTVGFNNIDVEEAQRRNIVVTNTRGTSCQAVAEHAVALMLAVNTRTVEADKFTRKGKFKGWNPNLFMGQDLFGKKVGIIGTGSIGQKVARILKNGFNCEIIYSDCARNENFEKEYDATFASTDHLVKESDIVTLHVPLLKETKHLINRDRLHLMKKSSILINTSRGPVVDEAALVHALQNNVIYGAGLDVFENEPLLAEGLAKLDNVVITPHIASARPSARNEMSVLVAKNIIAFFEEGKAITPVF